VLDDQTFLDIQTVGPYYNKYEEKDFDTLLESQWNELTTKSNLDFPSMKSK